jgi:HK97 gp10 family phage protein
MNTDTVKLTLDTRELERIAAGLNRNKREVVKAVAFEIERMAKQLAPKDTSSLANSIYTQIEGGGGSSPQEPSNGAQMEELPAPSGDIIAIVGTGMEYAAYQEFGTSKMASQPYLGPAVEYHARDLNDGSKWEKLFK